MRRGVLVAACCLMMVAAMAPVAVAADSPPEGMDPVLEIRTLDRPAELRGVDAAARERADRVTFEWDTVAPGYVVAYARDGGDGPDGGGALLEVLFTPAIVPGDGPLPPAPAPAPGSAVVEKVSALDADDGRVTFEIALTERVPFRVTELTGPPRIAIDLAHPEPPSEPPAEEPDPPIAEPSPPDVEPPPEERDPPPPTPTEFADDDGSLHEASIEAIAEAGITSGCDAAMARFCPDDDVRRGQMATFLARALRLPETDKDYFTDDDGTVHEPAINALAAAGVTQGCDAAGTRFCMTGTVDRAQMATFLRRGFDLTASTDDYFVDDERNAHHNSINALAAAGITGGCDDLQTRYCARTAVARAQMATFLARALRLTDRVTVHRVIEPGQRGPLVRDAQERLAAHGYWLGSADGVYGHLTTQAVLAFQKVHGLSRDGLLGPRTRAALAEPNDVAGRSRTGLVLEVDKGRQVILMVENGTVRHIFNTSTGTDEYYTSGGRRYLADTPEGRFRITRQIDGWRENHLGRLYRPKYFHPDGIAVHGATSIPAYPASHGCARLSMAAADWLWARVPIGSGVWVY